MSDKLLNGRELRVVEYLAALDSELTRGGDCLRERLKEIPNGWRQYRLICAAASRLLEAIYMIIPRKNLFYMQNLCQHGEVLIRFRPVTRTPENIMVREDDLRAVCNAAMAGECAVCLKEGKEISRCKLRGAMMCIAPPFEESPSGCGFRDAALAADYGKYL